MHWVDRAVEPAELEPIRLQRTPNWEAYYKQGIGRKPRDNDWNQFLDRLGDRFHRLCGYCEDWGKPQVDHFRPKSKLPELVYVWSNWVYSCVSCNMTKLGKWPPSGYTDPCAEVFSDRPESYFRFDTLTMEILPRDDQSEHKKSIAWNTIIDLGLNDFPHLRKRFDRLTKLQDVLQGKDVAEIEQYCAEETAPDARLSGIARAWLIENGFVTLP